VKKESAKEHRPKNICSFVLEAVSYFGDPTPAVFAPSTERRPRPARSWQRKPGTGAKRRRPDLGGGRAWWVRVAATAGTGGTRSRRRGSGEPQRRLSVDRSDPATVSCLLRRLSGSATLMLAGSSSVRAKSGVGR
jgi:hypothetical protein